MHYVGLRYIRYALIHGRQSLAEIIFIGFKKVNFIMTLATEGHVFSCNLKTKIGFFGLLLLGRFSLGLITSLANTI